MKLYEHPDFDQAILVASSYFTNIDLRPSIIEKDYYDQQYESLCYGSYPFWKDILSSFQEIRSFL